jgi:poly-gamma-glutamate capsule biosynthesis protein CapA/YwtB (metallophosphatase superfamily)
MRLLKSEEDPRLEVAAVGDVGVIGSARTRARREGFDAVFAAVRPHLEGADCAFANFELPVGKPEWVRPGRSAEFWQDPEVCGALARAGVGVVALATNHMMDCGPQGLDLTLETCASAGLQVMGAGRDLEAARRPVQFRIRDQRVAWLSYGQASDGIAAPGRPGIAPLDAGLIREDLVHWRSGADLLLVSVHWGSMYVDYPPPRVVGLARMISECGADLVLGHHPHVLQGAERIGKTLVLYSLGDIAFNCRSGDVYSKFNQFRETAVFRAALSSCPGLDVVPLGIDEDGFPIAAGAAAGGALLEKLRRISEGLDRAAERFRAESTPKLLHYELDSLRQHLRKGRIDRALKLILSVRPRHLPLLWNGLVRSTRTRRP